MSYVTRGTTTIVEYATNIPKRTNIESIITQEWLDNYYLDYRNKIEVLCKQFVEENFENNKYFDYDFNSKLTFISDFELNKIKVYIDNLFYTYRNKLRHENMINKIDSNNKITKKGNKI